MPQLDRHAGTSELAFRIAIVVLCTLAGVVWLVHKGPVPVIRITTPLPEAAPFWYMLSAFPVLGMLLGDLFSLYRRDGITRASVELAAQIALIVAVSNLRLGVRLPISGHSLIVSYFLFRRLLLGHHVPRVAGLEIAVAIGVAILIAYPKLAWWSDPVTLLSGAFLGGLLAGFSRWFAGPAVGDRVRET